MSPSAQKSCVVLTSSMVSFAEQKYNIESLKQLLNAHKIVFTEIDCSLEENKDARNFYFEASGIRANYPQVFLHEADSKQPVYIGSYSEIQELNEMNDLPTEILEVNKIATLNSVFADVPRKTSFTH